MRLFPGILLALVVLLVTTLTRAGEPLPLTERIYLVLAAQPRHSTDIDEPAADREARLREIAASVSSATHHATCAGAWAPPAECRRIWHGDRMELTAAVLAVGTMESHWSKAVQSSRCDLLPRGSCDRDPRTGEYRARGLWQHWRQSCAAAWELEPGSNGELRAGAYCAARRLALESRFCADDGAADWRGAFTRFSGRPCAANWTGAAERVATMRAILQRLRNMAPAAPQLDHADGRMGHTKAPAECNAGLDSAQTTDLEYILLGQCRIALPFSARKSLLGIPIAHIVVVDSKPKVRYLDTGAPIAAMQYLQAQRHGAMREYPSNPMCALVNTTEPKQSIAITAEAPSPEQTRAIQHRIRRSLDLYTARI